MSSSVYAIFVCASVHNSKLRIMMNAKLRIMMNTVQKNRNIVVADKNNCQMLSMALDLNSKHCFLTTVRFLIFCLALLLVAEVEAFFCIK